MKNPAADLIVEINIHFNIGSRNFHRHSFKTILLKNLLFKQHIGMPLPADAADFFYQFCTKLKTLKKYGHDVLTPEFMTELHLMAGTRAEKVTRVKARMSGLTPKAATEAVASIAAGVSAS